jgi:hypothetical protein
MTRALVPFRGDALRSNAMRKSRTHFEQIPLDVVKKIAGADVSTDEKAGTDNGIVKPVSRKSEPNRAPPRSVDRERR